MIGLVAAACGSGPVAHPAAAHHRAALSTTTTAAPVYPLTGLPATDPSTAGRPALSVKIDNAPGSFPQAGLDQADVVAEALVEGGLTRLFATFQSHDAGAIGPIRSARPVDATLLRELGGGIFAYSGAAAGEIAPARAFSTATLLSHDAGAAGFHLQPGRSAPHNLFASTRSLYAAGLAAGAADRPPPPLFTYSSQPQGGSPSPVSQASMNLSTISSAAWTWDAGHGVWSRTQNGSPDVNADGARVTAANVVILSVAIGSTGIFDAAGNQDPLVRLTGTGTAWVLRGGQVVQGTWNRSANTLPMTISGPKGVITLAPGTTWMELLPQPHLPNLAS